MKKFNRLLFCCLVSLSLTITACSDELTSNTGQESDSVLQANKTNNSTDNNTNNHKKIDNPEPENSSTNQGATENSTAAEDTIEQTQSSADGEVIDQQHKEEKSARAKNELQLRPAASSLEKTSSFADEADSATSKPPAIKEQEAIDGASSKESLLEDSGDDMERLD